MTLWKIVTFSLLLDMIVKVTSKSGDFQSNTSGSREWQVIYSIALVSFGCTKILNNAFIITALVVFENWLMWWWVHLLKTIFENLL